MINLSDFLVERFPYKEVVVAELRIPIIKANITGPIKIWPCNNFIAAYVTLPFMIYNLPISYPEELKAVATKYLKDWMSFVKTFTSSLLYRSKVNFIWDLQISHT